MNTKNNNLLGACAEGNLEMVKQLVRDGANVNCKTSIGRTDGNTPLDISCFHANYDIFKFLIEKGADFKKMETDGWTYLHTASEGGNLDIIKYLIKNGIHIQSKTSNGRTPLHEACQHGHLDVIHFLIQNGADLYEKRDDWIFLFDACISHNLEVVKFLMDKGEDIHCQNSEKTTPLHVACGAGNLEIVKYLIEKGANVNQTNIFGETPLSSAVIRSATLIEYLINQGANVQSVRTDEHYKGYTPLHEVYDFDVARVLVKYGADVNAKTESNLTPLHIACYKSNLEIVKLLIQNGADKNVVCTDGEFKGCTPIDIARINNNQRIVKYLLTIADSPDPLRI